MTEKIERTEKTVLVVDDDPSTCDLIREMLDSKDYRVIIAHDGLEAFEYTQRGRVDLILMDIRMPFFSGYWFCDAFKHKKNTANIPIVIVSGILDEEGVERAYKAGACAAVKKPFKTQELLDVISRNTD